MPSVVLCRHCGSDDTETLKIAYTRPVGARRHKCNRCNRTFITIPSSNPTQMYEYYTH